jgi:hypothetical protein
VFIWGEAERRQNVFGKWRNEAFCWEGEYDEAANYKTLFGTRMMVLDFFIPEGL